MPRRQTIVLADLIPGALVRDILLVIGAAGFVGLLAQITIHLPFTPVPMTGQTLGVLVAGTTLGWKRAVSSMSFYALAGMAGVPWFADHANGYHAVSSSFGYIIGFVLCAGFCGFFAERGVDRSVLKSVPAMIIGEVVLYAVGVTWLAVDLHLSARTALSLGFTPFLIGDSMKIVLASVLLPGAWKLVGRR
jgi:biotin transport system substrate-specific component